jgi:hypothetical protein
MRAGMPTTALCAALNAHGADRRWPEEHRLTINPLRWARWPAAAGLLLLASLAQAADVDVGVSIGINQPGVYGRIDIGRFPQPQVIVQRPVLIVRQAQAPQPVYLHVPPGHRKNWRRHCRAYNACGTPVYFVQERWYQDHVLRGEPRRGERDERRSQHRDGRRGDGGHGHGKGRGHD